MEGAEKRDKAENGTRRAKTGTLWTLGRLGTGRLRDGGKVRKYEQAKETVEVSICRDGAAEREGIGSNYEYCRNDRVVERMNVCPQRMGRTRQIAVM